MDNRPIGVFDSGLGGLTAVREFQRIMPHQDLIYFGDTGRVPYGCRSVDTIIHYAQQDVAFLRTFDLKAIVVACGTVSTTALSTLRKENNLPIWGVVEPAVAWAHKVSQNRKVGLIGTQATISSGAYEDEMKKLDAQVEMTSLACPLLVPLVEEGRFQADDPVVERVVLEYMEPFIQADVDTLILGCTHYPLLADVIGKILGPGVNLINVGACCAGAVVRELGGGDGTTQGTTEFYVSDRADGFASLAGVFLGKNVTEQVQQIDIEQY